MNTKHIAAAVVSLALITSACENLSPGQNAGLFGTVAGVAVGVPMVAAGVDPSIAIPVTAGAVAVAAVGSYVIAKHQATERQRKIAEQRARIYLEKQRAAERRAAAQAQKSRAAKKKKARYIAVETEKSKESQGKAAVMLFDTQTNQVVGNNVYDMKSTPQVGQTAKFDTYSAQYVGTGR